MISAPATYRSLAPQLALAAAVALTGCAATGEQPRAPSPEPATAGTTGTEVVFPREHWARAAPESRGLDPARLDSALAFLARYSGADQLDETLVVKDGFVVWAGDSLHRRHNIYSCSKSITSTALGLLLDEGTVELDDRAADYEPRLGPLYPEVTLRHFATMTSGYAARGASRWDEPSEDWGWHPYEPTEPYFPAGEAYAYWDEAQMMFGRVLTQAAGRDLYALVDEHIMRPIGVSEDWTWGTEDTLAADAGQPIPLRNGCTGVHLTAPELARVGWLYANHGVWAGDTLFAPAFARAAMSTQVPASLPVGPTDRDDVRGPGNYGYNWWTANPGGGGDFAMDHAPPDAAYMSGFNHNVCLVVPSERLVVVRMGDDGNPAEGKWWVWDGVLERLF